MSKRHRRANGKATEPVIAVPDMAPEMFLEPEAGLVIGQDDSFIGPRLLVFDLARNAWVPVRLANGQWILRQATPAPQVARPRLIVPGRPS